MAALISAVKELAGVGAGIHPGRIAGVHSQGFSQDGKPGVVWQPGPQRLPVFAASAAAPDCHLPVWNNPLLLGDVRDDVKRVGIARVNGEGKAEARTKSVGNIYPIIAMIVGA